VEKTAKDVGMRCSFYWQWDSLQHRI